MLFFITFFCIVKNIFHKIHNPNLNQTIYCYQFTIDKYIQVKLTKISYIRTLLKQLPNCLKRGETSLVLIVYKSVLYHTIIQGYPLSYKGVLYHTRVSSIIQGCPLSYKGVLYHTRVSSIIQGCPLSYKGVLYHTRVSSIIQGCPLSYKGVLYHTRVSSIIQGCPLSYKAVLYHVCTCTVTVSYHSLYMNQVPEKKLEAPRSL